MIERKPIRMGINTRESIRENNRVEVIDSAGFSLNPPIIDLPKMIKLRLTGPLVPYQNIRATNFNPDRFSGYGNGV
jgi:hypothetical protein